MSKIRSSLILGIAAGIVGTCLGTAIYYLYLKHVEKMGKMYGESLFEFIQNSWESHALNMVLCIGTILNLAIFLAFYYLKWNRPAMGVIYATIGWLVISGAMALFA